MIENPFKYNDYLEIIQNDELSIIFEDDFDFKQAEERTEKLMSLFKEAAPVPVNSLLSRSVCLLGVSGCGKTNSLAVILEEMARSGVSFSVMDLEGDLSTIAEVAGLNVETKEVHTQKGEAGIYRLAAIAVKYRKRIIYSFGTDMTPDAIEYFVWHYLAGFRRVMEKLYKRRKRAPHIIVLDEAHVFLPQRPPKTRANYTRNIIYEATQISRRGRKRGEGLLIASQRAADIVTSILSNMQVRFLMRVTEPADKERYRHTLDSMRNMDYLREIIKQVPTLRNGEAIYVPESNEAERVIFRLRDSFHPSATPGVEDYDDLSTIDLEELI